MIYYRLASNDARRIIELLYELFCAAHNKLLAAAVRSGARIE
jgi:hypothetical protein